MLESGVGTTLHRHDHSTSTSLIIMDQPRSTSPTREVVDVQPHDSVSNAGSASRSRTSSGKSVQLRRAALTSKAKYISQLHEVELQELKIKQQKEFLQLRLELADVEAVEAELNPHAAEWIPAAGQVNNHLPGSGDGAHVSAPSFLDEEVSFGPRVAVTVPPGRQVPVTGHTDTGALQFMQHQQTFKMIEALEMPKAELQSYDGDPINYFYFIRTFEDNVGNLSVDDSKKLVRLLHYCTGKARRVIQCCATMEPSIGYAKARRLLEERFGNKFLVSESWVTKITEGPVISNQDNEGLREFADNLRCCVNTLEAMGNLVEVNSQKVLVKIVERMPLYLQTRWRKEVRNIRKNKDRMPDVADLLAFVEDAAEELNDPVYGKLSVRGNQKPTTGVYVKGNLNNTKRRLHSTSFLAGSFQQGTSSSSEGDNRKCPLCSGSHLLYKCDEFAKQDLDKRLKTVKERGLCFNCLTGKHVASKCRYTWTCTIPGCGKKHHRLLHRPSNAEANGEHAGVGATAVCDSIGAGSFRVALPIVQVTVSTTAGDKVITTGALLDSGSTNTFCSSRLTRELGVKGEKVQLSLTTLESRNSVVDTERVSLKVSDVKGNNMMDLPCVFVRSQLPVHTGNLPRPEDISKWEHLSDLELPCVNVEEIGLLIGQDVPSALIPRELRTGGPEAPYAVKTPWGWTLNGPLASSRHAVTRQVSVNFTQADRNLEQQVKQFWEMEGIENGDERHLSVSDKRALDCWNHSAKLIDSHYELAIPFKERPLSLPNNRIVAVRRLELLKGKLRADTKSLSNYEQCIQDMVDKGYAERVSTEDLSRSDGAVWYLPHHGVTNVNKPDKLRVVFDCSAKFHDQSLNDQVMQGPTLINSLVAVLLRFRQDSIALMADIESMFHQVRVTPSDRDVLRFLWWPKDNMDKKPDEFRMCVHLFGGVWSPSCANFALKRTADDNSHEFSDEVIECVRRNFYVDDFLKSVSSPDRAVELIKDITSLLTRGGFRLTKWLCNNREVLEMIDNTEKAKGVVGLDLTADRLPIERALGVVWDTETDTFSYRLSLKSKPLTRRGILSIVSSIFDPLGLLSPCILPAKVIIQDLCRRKVSWDDEIPADIATDWQKWLQQLKLIDQLKISRCVKAADAEFSSMSLHHFCDASEIAYGVATYLRTVDKVGRVSCVLLLAKCRLAPLKVVTIPRLELCAAALAVRIDQFVRTEMDFIPHSSWFWTDSMIVLAYINNVDKRFKTFVANRIAVIHSGSSPSQWRHVRSELNPADDVSRGLSVNELIKGQRWFNGPGFLTEGDSQSWPSALRDTCDYSMLEVKPDASACAAVSYDGAEAVMNRLFQRYSSFFKLKKAVAWIIYLQHIWRNHRVCLQDDEESTKCNKWHELTVEEIGRSEEAVIHYVQRQCFIMDDLQKTKSLSRLDPFLSKNGILCVGGRLRKASLDQEAKHQVILPNQHPVVDLIICECHVNTNHSGKEHTLAKIRDKYWIIRARVAVRRVLRSCYVCRRLAAQPAVQRMADLPVERVTSGKPPFSYVGVDYFGPFLVKQGRSLVKRYGCLFTCLTIRAIHVEIAHSLDTDSFISALRRFISRRGRPEVIFSDNGTNFVAADKELREGLKQFNQHRISGYLLQHEIIWKFNPPAASHMGGVWERMIRCVRKVLANVVKEQTMNDETLCTVMCEAEAVVNSRPITSVSDDPSDSSPLTPNHLLTLRGSTSLPAGSFELRDVYRRRWKQAQYLADLFWKRWLREYLPALQCRHRWQAAVRNFVPGDIVLVRDDTMPRNIWPLGRIVDVYPGDDGLVRSVRVKTATTTLHRPITKICLLEAVD